MYVPWSILPIGYILLCHAGTYRQMDRALEEVKNRKSAKMSRRIDDDVVCQMVYSVSDAGDSDCESTQGRERQVMNNVTALSNDEQVAAWEQMRRESLSGKRQYTLSD